MGVLNTVTVSIASLQATIALKLLLEKETEPILYHFDIWNQNFKKLSIKKKESCLACNGHYSYLEKKETSKYVRFCSTGKYQIIGPEVDLKIMKARWGKIDRVIDLGETLQFKNILLFKDGRALIKANSEEDAQSLYSQWVGN